MTSVISRSPSPTPATTPVLLCARPTGSTAARAAMLPLAPVSPVTGSSSTWLPRDHNIRLDANDYSVHPADR